MRARALVAGIVVLILTSASQAGVFGGHDFAAVALVGLLSAGYCAGVAVRSPSRSAVGGLVLSLLPVALLFYRLTTSDG